MTDTDTRWLVVIVHYREPDAVLRRVRALSACGVPVSIAIADNSGDFPPEALTSIATPVSLHTFSNIGYGAAVNRCVAQSQARWDFLAVMTQDLEIDDGTFLRAACEILNAPDVGVVGPTLVSEMNVWSMGGKVTPLGRVTHRRPGGRGRVKWIDGAALALTRASWDVVGGFANDYFLYKEDAELGLRLTRVGRRAVCLSDVLAAQVPSPACHYLEVRNRLIFTDRNFGPAHVAASLAHVALRTAAKCLRDPRSSVFLLADALLGISDGFTRRLDMRACEGAVRRPVLYDGGPLLEGRRTREASELLAVV